MTLFRRIENELAVKYGAPTSAQEKEELAEAAHSLFVSNFLQTEEFLAVEDPNEISTQEAPATRDSAETK